MPFVDAEEVLERIGDIGVSSSSIWERSQMRGKAMKEYEDEKRAKANALPSAWEKWSPCWQENGNGWGRRWMGRWFIFERKVGRN